MTDGAGIDIICVLGRYKKPFHPIVTGLHYFRFETRLFDNAFTQLLLRSVPSYRSLNQPHSGRYGHSTASFRLR